jgi:hypothetical protein
MLWHKLKASNWCLDNDLGRAHAYVGDTCYIGSDRVAALKLHYPAIALAASNIAPSGCGIFWEP